MKTHPFIILLVLLTLLSASQAQTIEPAYRGPYFIRNLGEVNDFDRHGGAVFKPGDSNKIWMGGDANTVESKIYELSVIRGADKHVTGFATGATIVAPADGSPDGGGIDGGLILGPSNVIFYATYPDAIVGQIKPGTSTVAKKIGLGTNGVTGSTGSIVLVPPGFAGAGRLKILTYDTGTWYDSTLAADGAGTYNIKLSGTKVFLNDGLEGAFYVPTGSPLFSKPSVLVANYAGQRIVAYETDSNGDPIANTARDFITGLNGVDGSCVDPVTGDYIFTSFQDNAVYLVGGFGASALQVSITSPTNGLALAAKATFDVIVSAVETNGSIALVDLFNGTNLLGSQPLAPYRFSLGNLDVGVYSLIAVARDGNGLSVTSAVNTVTVTNVLPVVTITSLAPTNRFDVCSAVTLSATASDDNDSIAKVQFILGSTVLGEFTTAPYRMTLYLPPGTNTLYAKAFDTFGATANSATSTVLLVVPPPNTLVGSSVLSNLFHVCFQGTSGTNYVLERTTSLSRPVQWVAISTNLSGPGLMTFTDTVPQPATGNRFYRVRWK